MKRARQRRVQWRQRVLPGWDRLKLRLARPTRNLILVRRPRAEATPKVVAGKERYKIIKQRRVLELVRHCFLPFSSSACLTRCPSPSTPPSNPPRFYSVGHPLCPPFSPLTGAARPKICPVPKAACAGRRLRAESNESWICLSTDFGPRGLGPRLGPAHLSDGPGRTRFPPAARGTSKEKRCEERSPRSSDDAFEKTRSTALARANVVEYEEDGCPSTRKQYHFELSRETEYWRES